MKRLALCVRFFDLTNEIPHAIFLSVRFGKYRFFTVYMRNPDREKYGAIFMFAWRIMGLN